jgi:hypothetical protein
VSTLLGKRQLRESGAWAPSAMALVLEWGRNAGQEGQGRAQGRAPGPDAKKQALLERWEHRRDAGRKGLESSEPCSRFHLKSYAR